VHTAPSVTSAASTRAEGTACGQVSAAAGVYATAAMTRQVALAAMLGTPISLRFAIIGPAA